MELTQKGEMVSRLQAKAGQIGKILNNLEKYNHLLKDEKKSLERKTPPDKRGLTKFSYRENLMKNDDSTKETKTEDKKQSMSSDSTDSFVKVDLDLKSEEPME